MKTMFTSTGNVNANSPFQHVWRASSGSGSGFFTGLQGDEETGSLCFDKQEIEF